MSRLPIEARTLSKPGPECYCGAELRQVPLPADLAALSGQKTIWVHAVIEDMPEPRFRYCKTCSGHPEWPCPEVEAITAALTGKDSSDEG